MKTTICTNRPSTSIHVVTNDSGAKVYGVVGKVLDLLFDGILNYSDYSSDLWAFLPDNVSRLAWYGKTMDEALTKVREYDAKQ